MTEAEQHYEEWDTAPIEAVYAAQNFEELTLAELSGRFLRAPRETWWALLDVVRGPSWGYTPSESAVRRQPIATAMAERQEGTPVAAAGESARAAIQLALRAGAFGVAWWGNSILMNSPIRTEQTALRSGAPLLIFGFLLWLAAELYGSWPQLRANGLLAAWRRQPGEVALNEERYTADSGDHLLPTGTLNLVRGLLLLAGLGLSFLAVRLTADNLFRFTGFITWLASIGVWTLVLLPGDTFLYWLDSLPERLLPRLRLRPNWTMVALALIVILGSFFRLNDLDLIPPEMTSDHVEKLLDAQRVLDGTPQVFFPNNGGREPLQMYAMALFSQLPGQMMDFFSLKLLSAIEGLATLPLLWWMGRELIGKQERKLGNKVGLLLAGLVAASYWHTTLSRLALRIVLTPLITAILMVFLARALRDNRRNDYIKAGLALGFGMYTYQAARMLPLVVVLGVVLALIFKARTLRERGRYILNLAILAVIAFVVFMPLFGFWLESPEEFMRRTSGRLLGDAISETIDEDGNLVYRNPTISERWEALKANAAIFPRNMRNALLMFNWKGDVAWINGVPNRPVLNSITGGLFIVGLAAWLARMVRRRDAVDWLLPGMILIMLLPSALALAFPIEVPSSTRSSGTLPAVYLIAALPLALMVGSLRELLPGRRSLLAGTGLASVLILGSYAMNSSLYFNDYRVSYTRSSPAPYSAGGNTLHDFVDGGGAYGNAFMIAFPHWWDHRALGLEGGAADWPNGIITLEGVPRFLRDASRREGAYRLDPESDLLFYYSPDDVDTAEHLQQWFPRGRVRVVETYIPNKRFVMYRVEAPGAAAFAEFVAENAAEEG